MAEKLSALNTEEFFRLRAAKGERSGFLSFLDDAGEDLPGEGDVSPSLCVLEKLVHIEDPTLLPELVMVTYEVPDSLPVETVELAGLPADWRRLESLTQRRGDDWHQARSTLLLQVPSAIIPLAASPDMNLLINHRHPAASVVKIVAAAPFSLDPRLV